LSFKRIISALLCVVVLLAGSNFSAFALTEAEIQKEIDRLEKESQQIQNEINGLKNDRNNQQKVKNALDRQIANLQQQINICNQKISESNAKIAANEKEIANQREKMAQQIKDYKKRIRTLYMSGSTISGIEVLLGAEDFADFIALSQVSLNISRRDKKMIDDIVEVIEKIEEKSAENKKLIEEQKDVKATLKVKQDELDKQVAAVMKVIVGINSDIADKNNDNKHLQDQLDDWNEAMEALRRPNDDPNVDTSPFDGIFTWPVPGFTNRTSGYGDRWNKLHAGIDIAQGGIANAKVVAIASGTARVWCNTCTHNYGKYSNGKIYSCGCGGGYGNYLSIDHGTYKGVKFRSVYAHLSSVTVRDGQYVGKGQQVGKVGTTGMSSGYHLHFEIRENGDPKNPMNYY
jgi:murein DD-endopeptidase MepM/ murein hydrolase activator NlpD